MLSNVVILSPHYDDAVLSCGRVEFAKSVVAVTLFSEFLRDDDVPATSSPAQRQVLEMWGCSTAAEAVAVRRAEDVRACARLGFDRIELGYVDALFRRPVADIGEIFSPPGAEDLDLVTDIVSRIEDILSRIAEDALVLTPLAIGNHVDHVLTFEAGRRLASHGRRVLFYEDLPYSTEASRLARLRDVDWSTPPSSLFGTDRFLEWTEAVGCYASQLRTMFGTSSTHDALAGHAARMARDRLDCWGMPKTLELLPSVSDDSRDA